MPEHDQGFKDRDPEIEADEECRQITRDLAGGTKAMKAAGKRYLPQEAAEEDDEYSDRLKVATLFNFYGPALRLNVGRVFAEPVKMTEDTPAKVQEWEDDIDLQGNNLHVFFRRAFKKGMHDGVTHIVGEHQPAPEGVASRGEESAAGIRPYLFRVDSDRVLGHHVELIDGKEVVTQFRYRDDTVERDGEWGKTTVERVRVYQSGLEREDGQPVVRLFIKEQDSDNWNEDLDAMRRLRVAKMDGESQQEFERRQRMWLPVVTLYGNEDRIAPLRALPQFLSLAELNVLHWRKYSDYDRTMHIAAIPWYAAFGIDKSDLSPVSIGAARMVFTSNTEANIKSMEHSGQSLGDQRENLQDLELRMMALALDPMLRRQTGGQVATAKAIDEAKAHSVLQALALDLQDAIDQSLAMMASWVGIDIGDGGVDVNTDFGLSLLGPDEARLLLEAADMNKLTVETMLSQWRRLGILSEDVDPKTESNAVAEQVASTGMVRLPV